jgi:2-phosphoglycolate phosphatase
MSDRQAVAAITFDLDGTLVDSVPDLAAAAHDMAVELGLPPRSEDEVRVFVGRGLANLVQRCLGEHARDADLLACAIEVFKRCYQRRNGQHAAAYDGALTMLAALKAAGFRLGCVTNKPEAFTVPLLDMMKMSAFFDVVVSGDTLPQKKPDPGYNRIPVSRQALADLDTPLSAYMKLADAPYSYLLESVQGGERWGRYSILGLPARTRIVVRRNAITVLCDDVTTESLESPDPLAFVQDFIGRYRVPDLPGLPRFYGGLVGYFGYDVVRYVERRLQPGWDKPDPLGVPDIHLLLSDELAVFDNCRVVSPSSFTPIRVSPAPSMPPMHGSMRWLRSCGHRCAHRTRRAANPCRRFRASATTRTARRWNARSSTSSTAT